MELLREKYAWVCFLLLSFATAGSVTTRQTRTHCKTTCGNLTIEFPFGTFRRCVSDERFLVICNEREGKAFLNTTKQEVLSISSDGELQVLVDIIRVCYNATGGVTEGKEPDCIEDAGFTFSDKNQVTVVGCNVEPEWEYALEVGGGYDGCSTICYIPQLITDNSCSDNGCCKRPISKGSYILRVIPSKLSNFQSDLLKLHPCIYVFLVKKGYFRFSGEQDIENLQNVTRFPVILDWTMEGTCDTRSCGENTNCTNYTSDRGRGYFCKCLKGFEGNPYAQHGCKDIDECKMSIHSCGKHESCKNVIGSFRCKKNTKWKTIILGSVVGFLLFLIGVCCLMLKLKLWKRSKLRERRFEENGGILLVERLLEFGAHDHSSPPIKIFNEKEIKTATKGYHKTRVIGEGGQGVVFKGILSHSVEVAIKKAVDGVCNQVSQFINELVLLSQINHPHVVRLLGCCLETQVPLLVYEYVSGGTLYDNLFGSSLPWSDRLRIAAEIAETLSFLHFSCPVPVVHRDVKPANILLDEMLSVKLADFGASRLVPANTDQLTTLVQGTKGYLDPEYLQTTTLSEKSDVYSYGVVLMELVTGEKALCFTRPQGQHHLVNYLGSALRENRLSEVMDQTVLNAENHGELYQAALLAIRCTRVKGEERPDMRQVAAELQGLRAPREDVSGPSFSALEIEESNPGEDVSGPSLSGFEIEEIS